MAAIRPRERAMAGATPNATSVAKSARMTRIVRRRTRRATVSQRPRQGGQALSHGPSDDGEPQQLIVDAADQTNGTAERITGLAMIEDNAQPGSWRPTNSMTLPTSSPAAANAAAPHHVAQNDTHRRSAIDGRTTRHPGYAISMIRRKRIEEPFGWIKTIGGLRKTRHRGRAWSNGSLSSPPPHTI